MLDQKLFAMLDIGMQPEIYFSAEDVEALNTNDLGKVKRELDAAGLSCTIHAPFYDLNLGALDPLVREAVRTRYKSLAPVIDALKPRAVVIHTGYDRWRFGEQKGLWLENARSTLAWILEMFSCDKTRICIENVFDEDPYVLWELVSSFGPRVGVCLDVGHFNLFSKATLQEWLLRLGDRILELHLHDNDGLEDRHWAIGKGSCPLYTVLEWARGKKILHTIEAHDPEDAISSFKFLLSY